MSLPAANPSFSKASAINFDPIAALPPVVVSYSANNWRICSFIELYTSIWFSDLIIFPLKFVLKAPGSIISTLIGKLLAFNSTSKPSKNPSKAYFVDEYAALVGIVTKPPTELIVQMMLSFSVDLKYGRNALVRFTVPKTFVSYCFLISLSVSSSKQP